MGQVRPLCSPEAAGASSTWHLDLWGGFRVRGGLGIIESGLGFRGVALCVLVSPFCLPCGGLGYRAQGLGFRV